MTLFRDLRMAPKLLASFLLVAALAGLVGGTGFTALLTTHYWLDRIATIPPATIPPATIPPAGVTRARSA